MNLSQTNLSPSQSRAVLRVMGEKTRIKILKINELDLSSVPANILADALSKV